MFDADEEQLIRSSSIFQNQELERSYYEIKESFDSQILYLPTFRRIEKELDSIFKDLNPREINRRRHGLHGFHPSENSYLELVEFGMQDVEDYLDHEQSNLSEYTSHTLNSLTFRFLGDIVERKYHNETPQELESLSKEVIDSVLGRVNEDVLNKSLKDKIKNIITGLSSKKEITEHDLLISHYFNDLYQSHKTIEKSEKKIITFCEVCNSYLGDKKFIYERSTYRAMLKCSKTDKEIYLSTLSSGEKQIISLFSHLYLSGQNKFFVLIDEPELSLSVPWQKRFLEDISNGVFCQGLFAVTHSPFIFQNSLEKYTHGIGEFEI